MKPIEILQDQLNLPSLEQPLDFLSAGGCQVTMKRDDLIHPWISGNKWRKLKYNLLNAVKEGKQRIVTFGGPFSNHLVAVAASCQLLKVECQGIVRGVELDPNNMTLNLCRKLGMKIRLLHPDEYALRYDVDWQNSHINDVEGLLIEEGGSSGLFEKGVKEIFTEVESDVDYIVLPIGTGGTMYGLTQNSQGTKIIGISPFKKDRVNIPFLNLIKAPNQILFDYAMKGYGRYSRELVDFINMMWDKYEIPLDPIYNAKGLIALKDLLAKGYFSRGSKIIYLHTGGLQGIEGFNYVNRQKQKIMIPRNIYFPITDQ